MAWAVVITSVARLADLGAGMGDLVDRGGGLLHGGELLLDRGRLLLRRGADLRRRRVQVGGGGRFVRARSDRPDTIAFSVAPRRPISSRPPAASAPDRSPSPTRATNGITCTSGWTIRRLMAIPIPRQIRSVTSVPPRGRRFVAFTLCDPHGQRRAGGAFEAFDGGQLLAEGVEQLLALTVGFDPDGLGPFRRIGRHSNGGLAGFGLPRAGRRYGVGEEAHAFGILADQAAQAADCLVEGRAAGVVGFQAPLAAGDQIPAQPGLLIEHRRPEAVEPADQLVGAASRVGRIPQLFGRNQDPAAAENRHQRDDTDRTAQDSVETQRLGHGLLHPARTCGRRWNGCDRGSAAS